MFILLMLSSTFVFAMSSGEPERVPNSLDPDFEVTEGVAEETPALSFQIYPRPMNIPPRFENPENSICYNYANLLVRNGAMTATDVTQTNAADFLRTIYQYGHINIHHTAGDMSPESIIRYHMVVRGYSDAAYHFVIAKDGSVTQLRNLFQMGANAGQIPNRENDCSNNMYYMDRDPDYRSIGIALIGNFDVEHPTSAQMSSLRELISHLSRELNIVSVRPHQSTQSTGCPGQHFMSNYSSVFREPTAQEAQLIEQTDNPFITNSRNGRRNICYSCQ